MPFSTDSTKYNVFTLFIDTFNSNFGLTIENLLLTEVSRIGNDSIVVGQKNKSILADSLYYGGLQAVRHGNGRDWWLVMPDDALNGFYTFLIQKDSFIGPMYQSTGIHTQIGFGGLSHFSPDGTKFAIGSDVKGAYIFDFDRCSGVFSNKFHIPLIEVLIPFQMFCPMLVP